jgi:hypothetical protein
MERRKACRERIMKSGWDLDQRGLANKLLHVRRGSTEKYQGSPLFMGNTTRVRGLSAGPIEDDLVSGLKDCEWLVRNWLSSPAHPAHPAHPAIRFGGKRWLWLLSQSAKPLSELGHTKISEISRAETPSPYGNTSYIIHHTVRVECDECNECDLLRMAFRHPRQAYK